MLFLKSDVAGTSEAIVAALNDVGNVDASIKVVASGVGGIHESDVILRSATESMILGLMFDLIMLLKKLLKVKKSFLSYHSIIYELIDEVKARLSGCLILSLEKKSLEPLKC